MDFASCLQYPEFQAEADDFLKPQVTLSDAITACAKYITATGRR